VNILIDLAALLRLLGRQVRTRPLKESYTVPAILGIVGLFGSFPRASGRCREPYPCCHYGRIAGASYPAVAAGRPSLAAGDLVYRHPLDRVHRHSPGLRRAHRARHGKGRIPLG
jgi:hypothetical protein